MRSHGQRADILFYTMSGGIAYVALGIMLFTIDAVWPRPIAILDPDGT